MKKFIALNPIYIQKKTIEAGQTFELPDDVAASFELFLKTKARPADVKQKNTKKNKPAASYNAANKEEVK